MSIDLAKLQAPFEQDDIEWKVQACGNSDGVWARVVAYVANRAVMDRLDKVVGPENWRDEFKPGPDGGVLCGLSIRVGDEWVTKWDGAENTAIEKVKGGLSAAMKRAAVKWGIGRYLYDLPCGYAEIVTKGAKGARLGKLKGGEPFWWKPPALPGWAQPMNGQAAKAEPKAVESQQQPQHEPEEHPNDEPLDPTAKAKAAVRHAVNQAQLDRYIAAAKEKFPREQFASILQVATEKSKEFVGA